METFFGFPNYIENKSMNCKTIISSVLIGGFVEMDKYEYKCKGQEVILEEVRARGSTTQIKIKSYPPPLEKTHAF